MAEAKDMEKSSAVDKLEVDDINVTSTAQNVTSDHISPNDISSTILSITEQQQNNASGKELQESSIAREEHNLTEPAEPEQPPTEYLKGWRLHVLTVGVWVALFLSTLETTIVSTSLVSITNALGGFEIRDWVVTSYLITYTGKCFSIGACMLVNWMFFDAFAPHRCIKRKEERRKKVQRLLRFRQVFWSFTQSSVTSSGKRRCFSSPS